MIKLGYNYYINTGWKINNSAFLVEDNRGTTQNYYWLLNKCEHRIISETSIKEELLDKAVMENLLNNIEE